MMMMILIISTNNTHTHNINTTRHDHNIGISTKRVPGPPNPWTKGSCSEHLVIRIPDNKGGISAITQTSLDIVKCSGFREVHGG